MKFDIKHEKAYVARVFINERDSVLVGYYSSYDKAVDSVKGRGWWGADGTVDTMPINVVTFTNGVKSYSFIEGQNIIIKNETPEEIEQRVAEIKNSALSKLTEEEKHILGL